MIYVNGELHFNHTTAFIPSTIWPSSRSFTFGGREFPLDGFPLDGLMTDIQIFTEEITTKDMMDYTSCQKVGFFWFKTHFNLKNDLGLERRTGKLDRL